MPSDLATAAVSGNQIVVTGTARAGTAVVIAADQPKASGDTTVVVRATAGSDGRFRAALPLHPGTSVITAAAARGQATGWAQATVKA